MGLFDDICPTCGKESETVIHYLFNCPNHNASRKTMQQKLTNIIPEHCDLLLITDENQKYRLLNILLTGLNLDKKSYESILNVVYEYISDTGRFI